MTEDSFETIASNEHVVAMDDVDLLKFSAVFVRGEEGYFSHFKRNDGFSSPIHCSFVSERVDSSFCVGVNAGGDSHYIGECAGDGSVVWLELVSSDFYQQIIEYKNNESARLAADPIGYMQDSESVGFFIREVKFDSAGVVGCE